MLPVIILAGGRGTRLGELTKETPKPMVKIGRKPFLELLMIFLRQQRFRDIIMSVGYKKEKIIDYFGNGANLNLSIRYSVEDEPIGTAGAVRLAPFPK